MLLIVSPRPIYLQGITHSSISLKKKRKRKLFHFVYSHILPCIVCCKVKSSRECKRDSRILPMTWVYSFCSECIFKVMYYWWWYSNLFLHVSLVILFVMSPKKKKNSPCFNKIHTHTHITHCTTNKSFGSILTLSHKIYIVNIEFALNHIYYGLQHSKRMNVRIEFP